VPSQPKYANGTFQFTILSPPVSTIIQAATNLGSPIWVNVYTSTPPFTFTDLKVSNYPARFYQVVPGP